MRSILLSLSVLLGIAGALHAQTVPLTILHYNDFHAQNVPTTLTLKNADGIDERVKVGGLAVLKAYIDAVRDTTASVLLLHAGDDFQGTPVSSITQGRSQFVLLELMQPDAMTLGNHEFDYGIEQLRTLLPTVTFPIISANLWDKARGTPFVPRYRVMRVGGLTIGIIGLAPPDLPTLTMRENVRDLDVIEPAIAVRQAKGELEQRFGANVIVVLSHMGVDQDSLLAAAVGDIDVIVGGHSHTALQTPMRVNGALIVQAGYRGQWLGKLDMQVDAEKGIVVRANGVLLPTRVDGVTPDPVVAQKVAEYEALVDEGLKEIIGTLKGDWLRNEFGESALGNWQADVMRDYAKADVAFQNSGGIRKDLTAGPISLRDMWEISPFGNEFVTFSVTGAQLRGMLLHQAARTKEFCQVSGVRYRYDFTRGGDAALEVTVQGAPIDPARRYTVVTNSYVAGHAWEVFGLPQSAIDPQPVLPAHVDRDVFIDAVRAQRSITPALDKRITFIGERP